MLLIAGGDFCKTKADVVVLIQDSQGISTATVANIKTVVRRLLTLLSGESTDFSFALATYGKSRRMSCFGSATDTISYMDREYTHGQRGTKNLLKRALSRMILKQFQNRRDDRKGDDTAKVIFTCISFPMCMSNLRYSIIDISNIQDLKFETFCIVQTLRVSRSQVSNSVIHKW